MFTKSPPLLKKYRLREASSNHRRKGEVIYESLGKVDKEAFATYRKYLKVDTSNIRLGINGKRMQ